MGHILKSNENLLILLGEETSEETERQRLQCGCYNSQKHTSGANTLTQLAPTKKAK